MNRYFKHKLFFMILISVFILSSYGSAFGMGWYYRYVAPLKLNVSPNVYEAGQTGIVNVSGGKSPVIVSVSNPSVASVRQNNANSWTLIALNPGSASIIARDAQGRTMGVGIGVKPKPMNLTVNPSTITIGQQAKLIVEGGIKPYRVIGINTGIVAFSQIADNTFLLVGKMIGKSDITIQDAGGQRKTAQVIVQIPPLSSTVNPNTFKVGERATATLNGGIKPYYISNYNKAFVRIQQTGLASFAIIGLNPGMTDVVFKDRQGQMTAVRVTVKPRFQPLQASINPNRISVYTLNPAYVESFATLTVREGQPNYSVYDQRGITRINRVSLNEFRIYGNRTGSTNIVARDAAGKTVILQLTVLPPQAKPVQTINIQFAPPKDVFYVNETFVCTISGGTPNYSVYYSVPNILTAAQMGVNTFRFKAMKKGITEIKIYDRNGKFQTKKVEVK